MYDASEFGYGVFKMKWSVFVAVFFVVFLMCASPMMGSFLSLEDEQYANRNSVECLEIRGSQNISDVPSWVVGDEWVFEADIFSDTEEGLFDISSNDLTLSVAGLDLHEAVEGNIEVYVVDISADVSGSFQSSFLSGDVEGQIVGTALIRQADLSLLEYNISSFGVVEYLFFQADYLMQSVAQYDSSFEYFDFPLISGEQWNVSASGYQNSSFVVEGFYDNSSQGVMQMSGAAQCLSVEDVVVPAGIFSSFHVFSEYNGSIESWFAPEVECVARMVINQTDENGSSLIFMNLSSYSLQSQEFAVDVSADPLIVEVGQDVCISGFVNDSQGEGISGLDLCLQMSSSGISIDGSTDEYGFFSKTFPAPLILDSTNTSYDLGSDGLLCCVNDSYRQWTTVSVCGIGFDGLAAEPGIEYIGENVSVSCQIFSVNPLEEVCVNISGPQEFGWINQSLGFVSAETFSFEMQYDSAGGYSYFFWANDSMNQSKRSKTNEFLIIDSEMVMQNYSFVEGWNLLCVPLNSSLNASDLSQQIDGLVMVSCFDALNQSYDTYFVDGPSSFDFALLGGCGIFVLVDSASESNLVGLPLLDVQLNICVGWNLLGWHLESDILASQFSSNFSGAMMVSCFDALNQSYDTYFVGGPSSFDFLISRGMGFFVLSDEPGLWHGFV